ncbi:MAG: hydroxymethylbilane synthase [Gemmataceae bacterium]
MTPLRVGTRGSRLALWQANYVADRLKQACPDRAIELVEIQTAGDRIRDVPLAQVGGEGVFTKEIQRALLENNVDVAVHSLKDLPTTEVSGLMLAAVPVRAARADVFVSRRHACFDDLPDDARLATSSPRRRAQALFRRPDLQLVDIRGNVETRLRKLEEQELDGLLLAQAGLERLGLGAEITEVLDVTWMVPAVGQGALGLECRADDETTANCLRQLDDGTARHAALAERALLRHLGGGCQVPIGAHTSLQDTLLTLRGVVLAPDGSERIEGSETGPLEDAERLGEVLARNLLNMGARELLARQ